MRQESDYDYSATYTLAGCNMRDCTNEAITRKAMDSPGKFMYLCRKHQIYYHLLTKGVFLLVIFLLMGVVDYILSTTELPT